MVNRFSFQFSAKFGFSNSKIVAESLRYIKKMGNDDYNDQNEEEEIKRLEREVSRLEIRGQQRAGEAQRLRQELAAQEQQLRLLEVKKF